MGPRHNMQMAHVAGGARTPYQGPQFPYLYGAGDAMSPLSSSVASTSRDLLPDAGAAQSPGPCALPGLGRVQAQARILHSDTST